MGERLSPIFLGKKKKGEIDMRSPLTPLGWVVVSYLLFWAGIIYLIIKIL